MSFRTGVRACAAVIDLACCVLCAQISSHITRHDALFRPHRYLSNLPSWTPRIRTSARACASVPGQNDLCRSTADTNGALFSRASLPSNNFEEPQAVSCPLCFSRLYTASISTESLRSSQTGTNAGQPANLRHLATRCFPSSPGRGSLNQSPDRQRERCLAFLDRIRTLPDFATALNHKQSPLLLVSFFCYFHLITLGLMSRAMSF